MAATRLALSMDENVVERMNMSTRIIITAVLIGLLVFLCTVDESDPKTILALKAALIF